MTGLQVSKSTKNLLRCALFGYFTLWCMYPLLWVLLEIRIIDDIVSHVLHVILDVSAKSGLNTSSPTRFLLPTPLNPHPMPPKVPNRSAAARGPFISSCSSSPLCYPL